MKHQSHTNIIKRLKRSHGHLRKTIEMIEGERTCIEIAQQLSAVESAIRAAKLKLIHDHIDYCMAEATHDSSRRSELVAEFKAISRYF